MLQRCHTFRPVILCGSTYPEKRHILPGFGFLPPKVAHFTSSACVLRVMVAEWSSCGHWRIYCFLFMMPQEHLYILLAMLRGQRFTLQFVKAFATFGALWSIQASYHVMSPKGTCFSCPNHRIKGPEILFCELDKHIRHFFLPGKRCNEAKVNQRSQRGLKLNLGFGCDSRPAVTAALTVPPDPVKHAPLAVASLFLPVSPFLFFFLSLSFFLSKKEPLTFGVK